MRECEMIPERPADQASDLIMMNQSWEELSGHQPVLSGSPLHSNSMNGLHKATKHNRYTASSTEAACMLLSTRSWLYVLNTESDAINKTRWGVGGWWYLKLLYVTFCDFWVLVPNSWNWCVEFPNLTQTQALHQYTWDWDPKTFLQMWPVEGLL